MATWCVILYLGGGGVRTPSLFYCMGEREAGMYRKRVYGGSSVGSNSGGVYKRSRSSPPLSAKVKALQRKVALLSPEVKEFTVSSSSTNVTAAAGAINYLFPVVQGIADSNRIGDKIRALKMELRVRTGSFETPNVGNSTYGVTVVVDKESNGAIPTISGSVTSSVFPSFDPVGQQSVQTTTSDRFKILKQYVYTAGMLLNGGNAGIITFSLPLNRNMTYNATTGAVTDASGNQIYLIFTTNDSANVVDFIYTAKLYFTDL